MRNFLNTLKQLRKYPSAIIGLVVIAAMVLFSIYVIITLPYSRAISLWRGGENTWQYNPRLAAPTWTNLFRARDLPETIVLDSTDERYPSDINKRSETLTEITTTYEFDYFYDDFPREITLFIRSTHRTKAPSISLTWLTPDGREIRIGQITPKNSDSFRISLDETLKRRLGGLNPEVGLFVNPEGDTQTAVEGTYTLIVSVVTFEPESEVTTTFVSYGKVHGWAGTDHRRRDLSVALMWGAPVALAFGLLAAAGTSLATLIIAGVGTWFGGWLDDLIQRITEVNLILPILSILIMVGTLYNRSIWTMLGLVIIFGIFGGGIKTFRAIFLQVKNSPYIEAARTYGASNTRIIFQYMIPRVLPLLIPQLVVLVPTFVFLEASLAVLGLGDPVLPTWGKVIDDARGEGALFNGYYYWMIEPFVLLMITGFGFAMVGFALDRIFNPRLRDI
ncbi:MAG: ABC transporter permease [Anaerolineales bacterium]|nr:ABC transporter permease [Anaerolineales bacterium]